MKLTPWMLTVASFLTIALLVTGFLFKKLLAREVVAAPVVSARTLPMAISDIQPGTLITRSHVGLGPWRDPNLSSDTFLSLDSVVGRIARDPIIAAQPLRGSQFYSPGDYPELKVAENMRAVTINVGDQTAMVNGLIKPGQHVDVNLTVDQSAAGMSRSQLTSNDAMTLTLFEAVKVIAINRSYSPGSSDRGHNVTLELDEAQARIMLLASQKGTVALTFNPNGSGSGGVQIESQAGRVTLQQILGIAPVDEPEDPFMTEHYRAGGHSQSYFEHDRRVNGYNGRDSGGGVPLQGNSNDGNWNWSTSTNPTQRQPAQQAPTQQGVRQRGVTQREPDTSL